MSTSYRTVGWNANKRRYDVVAVSLAVASAALFVAIQAIADPALTIETLLIRALGATAFLLLHVILCIGPLARLDARFLPLLYNRRHLGVLMFTLALAHGRFGLVQFHSAGDDRSAGQPAGRRRPLRRDRPLPLPGARVRRARDSVPDGGDQPRLLAAPTHRAGLEGAAHERLPGLHADRAARAVRRGRGGDAAVAPGPARWRRACWSSACTRSPAAREARRDRAADGPAADTSGFVDVCHVDDIPERRAVITCLSGERVAIFRYDGRVSALSNVCQHQNGPLGEGRIVNDCVVCPWHGYEYLPESGASPPPFIERVPTFNVRLVGRPRPRRSHPQSAGHARRARAHPCRAPYDASQTIATSSSSAMSRRCRPGSRRSLRGW